MSAADDDEPEFAWLERLIEDSIGRFFATCYGAFALTWQLCFSSRSSRDPFRGQDDSP